MANKVLSELTIGNETFDLHSAWYASAIKDISLPAVNTYVDGASVQVTESGVYCIVGRIEFGTATTTGTTLHRVFIKQNGATIATDMDYAGSNVGITRTIGFISKVDANSSNPVTYSVGASCNRVISTSFRTLLYVCKLIDLGGVIRRLLNALKPLAFRLERGCA